MRGGFAAAAAGGSACQPMSRAPAPQSSTIGLLARMTARARHSTAGRRSGKLGRIDCRCRLASQAGGRNGFIARRC